METRRDFLRLGGLAAASAITGCATASPGAGWSRQDIEAMEATAGQNRARGWAAWQGGRRVAAWLPDARGPSLSITKSIAALAAARAASDGWLSASERVADTLSEWRGDPAKSRITVRMLLQQTSGMEAGVIALYRNQPQDKGRAAIALRCVNAPGSVFRYGPSHWEILAEVMRRKLSPMNETLLSYMKRAVMRPIGLDSGNWRSDGMGVPYFSTGTELSVNELGRLGDTIGRLLVGKSSHGISAANFAAMVSPSAVNPMFGGGLWRNSRTGSPASRAIEVEKSIDDPLPASFWGRACLSRSQPTDLVALIGSGGRRVYIWPGAGKRVARLGSSLSWSDAAFLARI